MKVRECVYMYGIHVGAERVDACRKHECVRVGLWKRRKEKRKKRTEIAERVMRVNACGQR